MRIVYQGTTTIDLPAASIYSWSPGEAREVPDEFAKELLDRGDFVVDSKASPKRRSSGESAEGS